MKQPFDANKGWDPATILSSDPDRIVRFYLNLWSMSRKTPLEIIKDVLQLETVKRSPEYVRKALEDFVAAEERNHD